MLHMRPAFVEQLVHESLCLFERILQLMHARLGNTEPLRAAELLELLRDARVLAHISAVHTAHMRIFDTAQEPPMRHMGDGCNDNGTQTAAQQGHTKDGCTAHGALGVVEKAVNTRIR